MQHRTIRVTVVMPTTPEGMAELQERLRVFNSEIVGLVIENMPISREQKLLAIDRIARDGIAPWAKKEAEQVG